MILIAPAEINQFIFSSVSRPHKCGRKARNAEKRTEWVDWPWGLKPEHIHSQLQLLSFIVCIETVKAINTPFTSASGFDLILTCTASLAVTNPPILLKWLAGGLFTLHFRVMAGFHYCQPETSLNLLDWPDRRCCCCWGRSRIRVRRFASILGFTCSRLTDSGRNFQ